MKYYITFGDCQVVLKAGNEYQACLVALKHKLEHYTDSLPLVFRVSKKGFEEHEDDDLIETDLIVRLADLSRKYEEEHETSKSDCFC